MDDFQTLASSYGQLLESAAQQRQRGNPQSFSIDLRELSRRLGCLQASARDVIELHSRVLDAKLASVPASVERIYLEEGRLFVLELMGYLLSYYRTECLRSEPARTRGPALSGANRRDHHG